MKERVILGAAFAGLVAIVTIAFLAFQFGRVNPSPPSLEDEPNPAIPGELLFRDDEDCIVRATASGERRERVYCGAPAAAEGRSDVVVWVDADTIGFIVPSNTVANDAKLVEVNLATKAETVREGLSTENLAIWKYQPPAPDGAQATVDEHGTVVLTLGGERSTVATFDVPDSWRLQLVGWSPDSQWMVLRYTRPREEGYELWLVSRDGETRGTLARIDPSSGPERNIAWLMPDGRTWPSLADSRSD